MIRLFAAACALVFTAACGSGSVTITATGHGNGSHSPSATAATTVLPPPPPLLRQVHDPGQVTGKLAGPCRAMDQGQLPDPVCTPGSYDPQITAAKLCAPGYRTSSYRPPESQTQAFKYKQAYPAYGIADVPGTTSELDHLVPLELGGSNDAGNLWPEAGHIPNTKDAVETDLHKWVCTGPAGPSDVRLNLAQAAIAADWTSAEKKLGVA